MSAKIIKQDTSKEFYFDEGCFIVEQLNDRADENLSIARARVEVGVTTEWHRLKGTVERYYIVSGTGVVEVGELPAQQVHVGDIVVIPAMCRQRISNTGKEDLIFLALCSPRFVQENYEAL